MLIEALMRVSGRSWWIIDRAEYTVTSLRLGSSIESVDPSH
jgi:hypothetical protein